MSIRVHCRTDTQVQEFLGWTRHHALTGQAGTPWFLNDADGHSRLDRMEQALRACTLRQAAAPAPVLQRKGITCAEDTADAARTKCPSISAAEHGTEKK